MHWLTIRLFRVGHAPVTAGLVGRQIVEATRYLFSGQFREYHACNVEMRLVTANNGLI